MGIRRITTAAALLAAAGLAALGLTAAPALATADDPCEGREHHMGTTGSAHPPYIKIENEDGTWSRHTIEAWDTPVAESGAYVLDGCAIASDGDGTPEAFTIAFAYEVTDPELGNLRPTGSLVDTPTSIGDREFPTILDNERGYAGDYGGDVYAVDGLDQPALITYHIK